MEVNISQNRIKKIIGFMVVYLCLAYVLEQTSFFKLLQVGEYKQEIIFWGWSLILTLGYFRWPRLHGINKKRYQSRVRVWALNIAVVYIIVSLFGGFIIGFGKSPYSHTAISILTNVFTMGIAIVGREYIRAYLIYTFCKQKQRVNMGLIILLMTLTSVRLISSADLGSMETVVVYLAEIFLPELCQNILASYLVLYGGAISSIIYLGIIEAFTILFPILPNLNWLGKGVIGIVVPVLATIIISEQNALLTKCIKTYRIRKESIWGWIPTLIISVLMIWFTVGVFPIYPSVIATGSMKPLIKPGDVILIDKVNQEMINELKVGDIMQFKRGDMLITHRIVEILEDKGERVYRTKGDNNSVEDMELVKVQDIKGIWVYTVPKIGWPTLIFKSNDPDVLNQVEF